MKQLDRVVSQGVVVLASKKGDAKVILANVREIVSEETEGEPIPTDGGQDEQPMYAIGSVYFRPDPPNDGGCCEAISMREDDGATVIGTRDVRLTKVVNAAEGETGIAQYGGGFVSLRWDADHSGTQVTILSPRVDGSGAIVKSHALIMDPTTGNASVVLLHQEGQGLVLGDGGAATLKNSDGSNFIVASDDGVAIGAAGGVKMVGGVIAGDTASAKAVALSPEVVDALTTIASALSAISTQLKANSVNGQPQGVGVDSDVAQLAADIAALASAGTATTLKASPV